MMQKSRYTNLIYKNSNMSEKMNKKLAIVIPAYKACFFRDVLDSIAKQNNRDFTVYIGDDASPDDLKSIVTEYEKEFDIVYFRFEKNLGRNDLVAHWERCISLSSEPLIWFFSDDDLMPYDGVERILKALQTYGESNVIFRFPLSIVDASGSVKYTNPPFEGERVSDYDFLLDKLSCRVSSAACEYVFSRDVWKRTGGFVRFPVAWCSDDATWAKFANSANGIISLPGNPVSWRNAEEKNISNSTCFDREKLEATTLFLEWIEKNYGRFLQDSKLHHALKIYVNVILKLSVRRNYCLNELIRLCLVLKRFSPKMAMQIAGSHVLGAKLFRKY